jgi:hypothetical protein
MAMCCCYYSALSLELPQMLCIPAL